jgi:SAM-dependent methyltransferase
MAELAMLDSVRGGKRFRSALEIGCAEGIFTEMLIERCDFLVAVDISSVALERARQRCQPGAHIRFCELDIREDSLPGTFDLIVAVHVLEYIRSPFSLRRIRRKLVDSLRSGGYLLVANVRNDEFIESTRWGQYLLRGGKNITAFIGRHPALRVLDKTVLELDDCSSIEMLCRKIR